MSLKFGNSNVTQVKFGPNTSNLSDVNKIVFNNAVAWCRPFILYISKDSGVSSVTVTRTKTEEPTAANNVSISDGGTVYFNDKLSISASPKSAYKLNSYDSSKTVTGDTLVHITSSLQNPVAPTISSVSTGGLLNSRTVTFTVKNNNPYTSTITYEISNSSGTVLLSSNTGSMSAGASTTLTKSLTNGNYNVRVRAYSDCLDGQGGTLTSSWSGYVSATYNAPILSAPSLSVNGTIVTVKNNNSVSVELWSLRPYANTHGKSTLAAGASTTINCEQDLGMAGQTSGTFSAYFKKDGYVQSSESSITVKVSKPTKDPLVYIKTFVPSITYNSSNGITIDNFSTLLRETGTNANYWDVYILRFHQRKSRGISNGRYTSGNMRKSTIRKFRMDKSTGKLKANSSGWIANTNSAYASKWVYKNCDDIRYGSTDYDNCFGVRIMPSSKTPYDQCFSKYSDKMYYTTSGGSGYFNTNDIINSIKNKSYW